MYNCDFQKNEKILFDDMNVIVECDDQIKQVAIVITNIRLIFLTDISKDIFLNARNAIGGGYTASQFDPIFEISKDKIDDYKYKNNNTEVLYQNKKYYFHECNLVKFLDYKIK